MKLHLPKMLTAALIAAITVLAANTTVQAETTAPVYSGTIYTWNGDLYSKNDVAYGQFYVTTYEGTAATVHTDQELRPSSSSNWTAIRNVFGDYLPDTAVRATLRFDGAYGTKRKEARYTFAPFNIGGIIVESGATGYSIVSGGNATSDRRINLGNMNGDEAYSRILEDFTINKTANPGNIDIYGPNTFEVAQEKTFTLMTKDDTSITLKDDLTVKGAGTVDFAQGRFTMDTGSTLTVEEGATVRIAGAATLASTIENAGKVNFNGTVSVTDFSGFEGDVNYSADDNNGFVLSATYTIWKGEGNVIGLDEISHGGKTLTVNETDHTVTVAEPDYTTYHLNTAGASVVVDTAAAEAREQGETLTTVNVKKTGATVTVNSELALPTLSIASGADATIDGTGTLTLTTLNNSGTVNIAAGLTMANAVNYTSSETPAIHVKEGGVLTILSNSKVDGAQIGSATGEQVNGAFTKLFTGKVVDVQEGGKLVLNGNVVVCDNTTGSTEATMTSRISELEIQGGFQINTYAVNPGTTWELGSNTMRATEYLWLTNHQFLTVAGGTVETGELRLGHSGNTAAGPHPAKFTATNGSTLTLGGIGLYGGHNAVSISDSNLTFNAAAADANVLAKKGTNANTDSTVTLADTTLHAGTNGWSLAPIDNVTVTVSGTTTVDLGGKQISLEGTSIGGKFVFGENTTGTLLLSSADGSLEETLTLNGATVGFAGIWDLSALDDGSSKPTYEGGESDKNGYKAFSTSVTLADLQAGGSITEASLTAAEFYISDVKGTLDRTTGTVSTSSERDYTVFHVNEGIEKVSKAREGSQSLQSIDVKAGATLNVDQDANLSLISAVSGATLEIASDKVLTVDGTATTAAAIAGSGTYALKEGSKDLAGATLDDGWTGTVRLSGSIESIKFDASVLGDHVEAYGLSGFFYDLTKNGHGTYAGTLTLTNPGEDTPALLIYNGYTRENAYYELSGTVDGNGIWRFDKGDATVTNRIIFSGDTAHWDGALELVKGYTLELTFAQTDGAIGAAITRIGGTLNMIVGSESGQSTVFNQNVTASALTISEGATATFAADATFDSLSGAGALVVDEGATLKITGDVSADVAIVAKNGAVIDSANVDPVHVGIDKESTATFVQGIAKDNGISFSEGAQVTNNGGEAAAYDTDKATMAVQADEVTFEGTEALTVANDLTVVSIVNNGSAALTLTQVNEGALESIQANTADVTVHNVGATELAYLVIGKDKTVSVYADETVAVEGTVTITDALVAGGATLHANLVLANGSTLDLQTGEGAMAALTLGSNLAFVDGAIVNLDATTLAKLDALVMGSPDNYLELVKAATGTTLTYGEGGLGNYDDMWFGQLFDRTAGEYTLKGDFKVVATGESFGLTKVSNVPEPTTGTLSLLALAALAARRRKH